MKIKILLIFIIISMLIPGCITNNNDDKEYNMVIAIKNNSAKIENITIIVLNSNNIEIFNNSYEIKIDEYRSIRNITKETGKYIVIAFIDENRTTTNDKINVGKDYGCIHLRIYNDHLDLHQDMK